MEEEQQGESDGAQQEEEASDELHAVLFVSLGELVAEQCEGRAQKGALFITGNKHVKVLEL
jgi:hypothetical protein